MRVNGTLYPKINELPANGVVVSKYATDNDTAVGYVYHKYNRFTKGYLSKNGKTVLYGSDPGYTIRCFNGINFVIPNTKK